ncbi:unnamed protein product, partial [Closterium sp. NIES-54]
TDFGEVPRSPPVLYVDNKAMLALCREHRLEHRTKHIALRYFLARELQQRGQLRLAYVASQANTADIFTEALPPGDHQRFCTMLAQTVWFSYLGVPPPPSCPLLLLLLRPTSVVSSRSELRLPLAGDAAPAGARGARALVGLAGVVEVVVEAVEGVKVVVGVVAGVEVSVAAVEVEEAAAVAEGAEAAEVAEAEEVAEAAEAAVELVAALRRGVAPMAVSASSSSAVVRPRPPSSFVSGTLGVSEVGVLVLAPTFSVPATALVSSAGACTPPSAASAA